MAQFSKIASATALFGAGALMMSVTAQAETSITTDFTATIAYEGGCNIQIPNIVFNNGNAVLPSQIEGNDEVAQQKVELTLSGCQGMGLTPKIGLTGPTNNDTGTELYLDTAGSETTGYGILLATDGNAIFASNENLAAHKEILVKSGWDTQTDLTTLDGTIPLIAILSCGTPCSQGGRIGGELVANVTFEFQYD
ncbi:fimbrial-like protein [Providencia stuartii]|uniref:fimbrial-like protein n=1 Tax=Providencia stuartii TaxID=588 RepID=UPI00300C6233